MMYPTVWLGSARECGRAGARTRAKVAAAKGEMKWRTALQTRKPKARRLPTKTYRQSSVDTPSISLGVIPVVN